MSNLPVDPKNPEGAVSEKGAPIFETSPTHEPTPAPEKNVPLPTPDNTVGASTAPLSTSIPQDSTDKTPRVVDKTDEITSLHEIKSSPDKLTTEADEEEERFIEEVEKHHGDL